MWEFIRDLLLNPLTNPSLIRWERREDGIFKFIQSDKVAKMWGERKQNPRMTYEKLSRAMRYVQVLPDTTPPNKPTKAESFSIRIQPFFLQKEKFLSKQKNFQTDTTTSHKYCYLSLAADWSINLAQMQQDGGPSMITSKATITK